MTTGKQMRLWALVASIIAGILLTAAPTAAQGGDCAGVWPGGCLGDYPCKITPDQPYGSAEWDESEGCLLECPEPVHCHPDFASNASELSTTITEAIDLQDVGTLRAASQHPQVVFNASRDALQLTGCEEGTVVAHFPLPAGQALALRDEPRVATRGHPQR